MKKFSDVKPISAGIVGVLILGFIFLSFSTVGFSNDCSVSQLDITGSNLASGTAKVRNNGPDDCRVTLVSYNIWSDRGGDPPHYIAGQTIHDSQTINIRSGRTADFTVSLPNCYTQVDLVLGDPIVPPFYSGSNMIKFEFVGSPSNYCNLPPPPPPPPPAPGTLTAVCVGGLTPRIELEWTLVPNQNSNSVQKGDMFPSDPNQFWGWLFQDATLQVRHYTDTAVGSNQHWSYRVKYSPNVVSNQVNIFTSPENCGFVPPVANSISGMKFNDLNGNGAKDAHEPGLSGWTIFNDANNNGQLDAGERSAVTAGNGNYILNNLTAGTYRIREVQQTGWTQTTANPAPISVSQGQNIQNINFGNRQPPAAPSNISGMKFNDLNANGVKDSNEPGLSGWTIELRLDVGGPVIATTTTDANGNYAFTGVPAGTYSICEVMQSQWTQTLPNSGIAFCAGPTRGYELQVAAGQVITNKNFGNNRVAQLNSVSGIKFNDLNGNGLRDRTEPGLEGWTIQLLDANSRSPAAIDTRPRQRQNTGGVVATTVTDESGNYEFTGVANGAYLVCEVMQTGWTQTAPTTGPNCPDGTKGHSITVSNGQSLRRVDFGNRQPPAPPQTGSISGKKIEDINHNGQQDPGEPDVPGWEIILKNSDGNVITTMLTDANGRYVFSNLSAGTYIVCEEMQPNWMQIFPTNGPDCGNGVHGYSVTLAPGQSATQRDFGNQNFMLAITIRGMKFNDLDGDGVKDANEPGLANWTIFLDANNNGQLDGGELNTRTDQLGRYDFTNLIPGTYRVREVQQDGWTQTTENPGPITVSPGQTVENVDFGNQRVVLLNSISGMKFKDLNGNGIRDANEPGLSGWTIVLRLNEEQVATTVTDAEGDYEFTGVASGTYLVCEILQTGWNQTAPRTGPQCPPTQLPTRGYTVTVNDGQSSVGNDFGNQPIPPAPARGSISGKKIEDINHNGNQDPGEPDVADWRIFIDSNGNGQLDQGEPTVLTDVNGRYVFSNLAAGTYIVCEEMQPGWMQIFPTNGPNCGNGVHGYSVVLTAGQNVTGRDFGNQNFMLAISISGMKFNDLDGDGELDENEPGLEDWTIFMDQNNNGQLDPGELNTQTGANGNYIFENLIPGTYRVREVQQEGWIQTTENPAPITVGPGDEVENINFGNQEEVIPVNSISGMKFNDLDGDGVKDVNEPGLEGWTIQLRINGEGVIATTVTDDEGNYEFTGVADGTYKICEVLQSGWAQTYPISGPNCPAATRGHRIEVEGGVSSINNDFGNRRNLPGSISGVKFKDINRNGIKDSFEPGLYGFVIYIDRNGNGQLDQGEPNAISGGNGNYTFTNLMPGNYLLREVQQTGWTQTTPNPNVTLQSGQNVTGVNFGNTPFATQPATITTSKETVNPTVVAKTVQKASPVSKTATVVNNKPILNKSKKAVIRMTKLGRG